jgi:hypothetical protein
VDRPGCNDADLAEAGLGARIRPLRQSPVRGAGWPTRGSRPPEAAAATEHLQERWKITLPYGVLVGVLLYLDLRVRKEALTLESLRADLQASAA